MRGTEDADLVEKATSIETPLVKTEPSNNNTLEIEAEQQQDIKDVNLVKIATGIETTLVKTEPSNNNNLIKTQAVEQKQQEEEKTKQEVEKLESLANEAEKQMENEENNKDGVRESEDFEKELEPGEESKTKTNSESDEEILAIMHGQVVANTKLHQLEYEKAQLNAIDHDKDAQLIALRRELEGEKVLVGELEKEKEEV